MASLENICRQVVSKARNENNHPRENGRTGALWPELWGRIHLPCEVGPFHSQSRTCRASRHLPHRLAAQSEPLVFCPRIWPCLSGDHLRDYGRTVWPFAAVSLASGLFEWRMFASNRDHQIRDPHEALSQYLHLQMSHLNWSERTVLIRATFIRSLSYWLLKISGSL